MTPTARTLKHLRDAGYLCEVVEHYNSFTRTRKDLFSFGDIIAIRPNEIVLVQTTTADHIAHRRNKITGECADNAKAWLAAGGNIVLHGWSKRPTKAGGKASRWGVTVEEITADLLY